MILLLDFPMLDLFSNPPLAIIIHRYLSGEYAQPSQVQSVQDFLQRAHAEMPDARRRDAEMLRC